MQIANVIANEFNVKPAQIEAVISLLKEDFTVPFIARYRKEATGGLSDTQLREIVEKLNELTELEERRNTILKTIEEQGKLTTELREAINQASDKTMLEDLYLPYKPKRRTKAQIAKELGLEPLALELLGSPHLDPNKEAIKYVDLDKGLIDSKSVLEGVQHILMEIFTENAQLLAQCREYLWQHGLLYSKVITDKIDSGLNFKDYFDYKEAIKQIPSHRALALFRGRSQGILQISLKFSESIYDQHCCNFIIEKFNLPQNCNQVNHWLLNVVNLTWKIKLHTKLELELLMRLKERAEEEAINVFKDNLKNLLMQAPAGNKVVMGLDPGLRTGVKVAIIDGTGKVKHYATVFPHAPRNLWQESIKVLADLCEKYEVKLISIGNGTASRETDRLIGELVKLYPGLSLSKVVVSEAGASVYSASALAAEEFPELDVTIRGAVSIARRLQDPLAELVKIDPKSIGVGQYQHDVNQYKLNRSLKAVLEDCVNKVGADINTASVPLLSSVAGLNESIAKNIVTYREEYGRFANRDEIKKVPRLGPKTFEQAAGFLRIIHGSNPLDASAVHPESYHIVEHIAEKAGQSIEKLLGNNFIIDSLSASSFVNDRFGLPTILDIIAELKKPGRDPRPSFKVASYQEGIESISDLKVGMQLEGTITNVANFGAFVDIGVHHEGLIHISELANNFVKDIHQVVKVGQIVSVKVIEVDISRKRISLSMKESTKQKVKSSSNKEERFINPQSLLSEKLGTALNKYRSIK